MSPTLDALLEPLIHSPRLTEISAALQERLRAEAARRERFYDEMADDQKSEFIDGAVVMHSPAKNVHSFVRHQIARLLSTFVDQHHLGVVRDEKCLCVFPRNDYEPDVVFFGLAKAAAFQPDTMKFPVPDLAVEVLSSSTEARDRGVKFDDYEAHGVTEYWLVDPDNGVVEQFLSRNGRFELVLKSGSGDLTSPTLGGLTLPLKAFFDPFENLTALQTILNSRPLL